MAEQCSSAGRFPCLSESDKDDILGNKCSHNTKQATKFAINVFHEYCISRHSYQTVFAVDSLPTDALDKILETFYAKVRNKNGEKYLVQTLRSLRAGIHRYYTEPPLRRAFNLMNGENFQRSRAMFDAVCVDLKRTGLGDVVHKSVLYKEDMKKVKSYFSSWRTNSTILLHKVWFDIMIFNYRRGVRDLEICVKTHIL